MIIMLVILAIKILVMNNFQDHDVDDIGDVQMKMFVIILVGIRIENLIL